MNRKIIYLIFIICILGANKNILAQEVFSFSLKWPEDSIIYQFKAPSDVAVDSQDYVYVVDTEHHRIQRFDPNGNLVTSWGREGSSRGEFFNPQGITVDKEDNIYIVDTGNNRIQKFRNDGQLLGIFNANFNSPTDIAVDSEQNIYVVDTGNNRVLKLDSTGNLKMELGTQTKAPQGLVTDNNDNVYVVDTNNNRILKFDKNGNIIQQWGSQGNEDEKFDYPTRINIDKITQYLYIVDTINRRVQVFDINGNSKGIKKFGTRGSGLGEFESPRGIDIDSKGNIYVADPVNNCVQKFNESGTPIEIWSEYSFKPGRFNYPIGIAVDSQNNIYVVDSNNHRIQQFDKDGNFIRYWGGKTLQMEDGKFQSPYGITIDTRDNDRIYIADTGNCRIQVFKANGTSTIKKWGRYGFSEGNFLLPYDLAIDSTGLIYVIEKGGYLDQIPRVQVFDKEGKFIKQWFTKLPDETRSIPVNIEINSKDEIYVVDTRNNCIKVYNKNGELIKKIGKFGVDYGEFNAPFGISIDRNDNIYVVDSENDRIQMFNSDGKFITSWGQLGDKDGEFTLPTCIAVDKEGNIYVVDTGNQRIQKFEKNNSELTDNTTSEIEPYNFPNPFNPNKQPTNIVYYSSVTQPVTIKIYNLAGELVRTIIDSAGDGKEEWDGKNDNYEIVSEGIYFCVIKTKSGTKRFKIAVSKK